VVVWYTSDLNASKLITVLLFAKKLVIHLTVLSSILRLRRLWSSLACKTLSKAPETSSSRRLATCGSGEFQASYIFSIIVYSMWSIDLLLRPLMCVLGNN
jgi:hypothetical protein